MQFDPKMFEGSVDKYAYVGSRITCSPAPTDTDQDVLVLVLEDEAEKFLVQMQQHGFDVEMGEGYAEDALNGAECDRFQSYRLGDTNLIATIDRDFYQKFMAATTIAKRLNLVEKQDRISLFQAVLYGNPCAENKVDQIQVHDWNAGLEFEEDDPELAY